MSWEILFSPAWMSAWRRGPIASCWRTNTEPRSTWLPILREEIIYIDKVDNNSSVVVYSQIGKRAPMYCTGVGKAILAFLPEEYMEKYVLSRPLIKMTEHTITTGDGLLKELEQVRERGYAVDDEEIEPGLHCIAAPIFNHKRQPQMAISMSFPYGRMWDLDWEQAVRDVLYYAKQTSERLGYIK